MPVNYTQDATGTTQEGQLIDLQQNKRHKAKPITAKIVVVDGTDTEGTTAEQGEVVQVTAVSHHTRYLRVGNLSGSKATFYIQCYTQDENDEWVWSPGKPEEGTEPLAVEVEAGETVDIYNGEWQLNGSKLRIWGKNAKGREWNTFKDKDCVLVSETADDGTPTYLSNEKEVFDFIVK